MNKQCGIWIDGKKAILVHYGDGGESLQEIPSEVETRSHYFHEGDKGSFMGTRHINNEKTFAERKHHQIRKFVERVLEQASHADDIYVMGPASMKTRVGKAMREDPALAKKLRAVRTVGPLTEAQLKANVKAFFQNKPSSENI